MMCIESARNLIFMRSERWIAFAMQATEFARLCGLISHSGEHTVSYISDLGKDHSSTHSPEFACGAIADWAGIMTAMQNGPCL